MTMAARVEHIGHSAYKLRILHQERTQNSDGSYGPWKDSARPVEVLPYPTAQQEVCLHNCHRVILEEEFSPPKGV